jgi:hypothetical protein
MAIYRYFTADILTGTIQQELFLYGLYMNKYLLRAGNFNGTFQLGTGRFNDADLLAGTIPGKSSIYCTRNGEFIWGGPIWSRTYSPTAKTVQLTAQTYESVWDHVIFETHFIQQDIEQIQLFMNAVNQIQAQPNNNFGFVFDAVPPTSTIKRTILLPDYEYHFAQEAINDLLSGNDSFEYRIDLETSGTVDVPIRRIKIGYPRLGSANNNLWFDFPGNIDTYWYPENASRGAVKTAAIGYGSGNKVIRASAVDGDKLSAGWPAWWQVNSYKNIADPQLIASKANEDLIKLSVPVANPTFDLNANAALGFSGWNSLGDDIVVNIKDARFPSGISITNRMVGWELTPASSESDDMVKLVLEGGD